MKYNIDSSRSRVTWVGSQPSGTQSGSISIKEGEIEATREDISGELVFNMKSIEITSNMDDEQKENLRLHLLSEDFFDVANHPEARFKITRITPIEESEQSARTDNRPHNKADIRVEGELTIKDITETVVFSCNMDLQKDEMVVNTQFKLDRTRWGMNFMVEESYGDKKILPEVQVGIHLFAPMGEEVEEINRGGSFARDEEEES